MNQMIAAAIHPWAVQENANHGGHTVSSHVTAAVSLTYAERSWHCIAALGRSVSPIVFFFTPWVEGMGKTAA